MSKNIDENVVSMRFDNYDFERNVKTSMSTLDRLKNALKFDNVQNGVKQINNEFKKVDMKPVETGVQRVQASFSALQVVGMTALANITNQAINAGKQMVSAFTIKPITDGFREYETQMTSVQTIMANTASKGTTIEQVTDALNELNEYADQTIYNFTQMTENIGRFTSAGVDLDKSVAAIKGIANLGAMSGSTAAQVNSAMYQLSQALATGRVSLMDWNSVVNAGMGGEQFQNALKRTAEHFGTNVDAMIEKYGSFRESLTQGGWLTADVLTETLNQISGAYTEADLIAQGYTADQARAITEMANTAKDAATKVTSFTKMMDTLNEAVGSGWAQTFQILFGDFYEAREFFTDMSNYLGEIIQGVTDARNSLLGGAFDSKWAAFTEQLDASGVSVDNYTQKLREVANESGDVGIQVESMINQGYTWDMIVSQGIITTDMFNEALRRVGGQSKTTATATGEMSDEFGRLQQVVSDVWSGNYGNIDTGRIERLTAAGYDYAQVQDLVNRTVNDRQLNLEDLTQAEIEAMNLTEQEAEVLTELAVAAQDANDPMHELIESMSRPSGRVLFLESLENMLKSIMEPLKAVGAAFGDVFQADPEALYDLIDGFHSFSETILLDDTQLANLQATFRGFFSLVKLVATVVGGPVTVAFKLLRSILGFLDVDILSVTGSIGDAIYQFEEWIDSGKVIQTIFDKIGDAVAGLPGPIKDFISQLSEWGPIKKAAQVIENLKNTVKGYWDEIRSMKPQDVFAKMGKDIQKTFDKLVDHLSHLRWSDVLKGLTNLGEKIKTSFLDIVDNVEEIGPDIIAGLQNGLEGGIQGLVDFMIEVGEKLIQAVKNILGIQSPSKVFFEIGVNIIEGLCNGIKYISGQVTDTLSAVIDDITEMMSHIDWGTVIPIAAGVGSFIVLYQLTDAMQTFATGIKGFSAPFQQAGNVMKTVDDFLKKVTDGTSSNKGLANAGQGIKLMAEAIAILAASVGALSLIDVGSLFKAVVAIIAIAGVLAGLAAALTKFSEGANIIDSIKLDAIFLSLAGAFAILAVSAKILSTIDDDGFYKAVGMFIALGTIVGALILVSKYGKDVDQVATVLTKIGAAFLLVGIAARLVGGMDPTSMGKAAAALVVFGIVVGALVLVNRYGGGVNKSADVLAKIGAAFLLLGVTARLLGGMSWGEFGVAVAMIAVFTGVVAGLVAINKFGGSVNKSADVLREIGVAFLLLGIAARLLGGMDPSQLDTAIIMITVFGAVVSGMVALTSLAPGKKMAQVSTTLISMSLSIGIMAGVAVLLSKVDPANLENGVRAVTQLAILVTIMTAVARGGKADLKGTMIGIAIAIGAVAASVAILSFIDPNKLAVGVTAMSIMLGMLALVVKMGSNMKKATGTMVVFAVIIAELAGALYVLSSLPMEKVLGSAISLSLVLGALAAALKVMGSVGRVSKSAMKAMVILAAVMGVLGAIFGALAYLNLDVSLQNAVALSAVLEAMAVATVTLGKVKSVSKSAQSAMKTLLIIMAGLAVIFGLLSALKLETSVGNAITLSIAINAMASATLILGKVGRVSKSAQQTMTQLLAIMLGLAAIFGVMSAFNVEASFENAVSLSLVLNAMASALLILDHVNTISPKAIIAMYALTGVVGLLGVVFALLQQFDLSISLETALALSTVLIAMSVATGILAVIGSAASAALSGAGALAGVLGVITAVIIAAGALKQIPGFEWLINEGGDMLQQVGNAIGKFIGGIGGGLLEGVTGSLPAVADSLSDFMIRLTPFIAGANMITPESMQSIKMLAEALMLLTAGSLLEQLTSFLTGGSSLADFAAQIVPLGAALASFSAALGTDFNGAAVQQAATAAKALAEMATSLPKEGGLATAIFGETVDMESFGEDLKSFGKALADFSSSTGEIDATKVQQAAQAGQSLAQLATALPKDGGLAAAIFGESTDMETFGEQIVAFGKSLVDYSTKVTGLDVEAIQTSVGAGEALAQLGDKIPSSGGVIELFSGTNDFKSFGDNLVAFGDSLVNYADSVGDLNFEQINGVTNAVTAVVDLINNNSDIDTASAENLKTAFTTFSEAVNELSGGILAGIGLSSIAEGLSQFGTAAQSISNVDFATVGTSIQTFSTNLDGVPDTLTQASDAFIEFATAMIAYGLVGLTFVASSLNTSSISISTSMSTLSNAITSGSSSVRVAMLSLMMSLTAMAPSFASIGNLIVTSFIIGSTSALTMAGVQYKTAGTSIAQGFKIAIGDVMETVPNLISKYVNNMVNAVQGHYQDFYNAGYDAMRGLRDGINAGASLAINAAGRVAKDALQAAKNELDIQSPSKEFRKVGQFADEGLALGFRDGEGAVVRQAGSLAQRTLSVVTTAMAAVADIVQNGDTSLEINPVIRPVVDDSGITFGGRSITASLQRTRITAQGISTRLSQDNETMDPINQNGEAKPTTVSFVQNNYSPKALSRIDIYRDTKNQISQMKGALA